MSKAREIIESLHENSPVAPSPQTKPVPKSPGPLRPKPGTSPKHNPWRRRDVQPNTTPKPKACSPMESELEEAKKAKKTKGQVAPSPGKVAYGKKGKGSASLKESLARRLLES